MERRVMIVRIDSRERAAAQGKEIIRGCVVALRRRSGGHSIGPATLVKRADHLPTTIKEPGGRSGPPVVSWQQKSIPGWQQL